MGTRVVYHGWLEECRSVLDRSDVRIRDPQLLIDVRCIQMLARPGEQSVLEATVEGYMPPMSVHPLAKIPK